MCYYIYVGNKHGVEKMMTENIAQAVEFATQAHEGQVRKYTGEPYITHPLAVADIVRTVDGHTEEMIVAAILHDTVEDCDVTIQDIELNFGDDVAFLVHHLTEISAGSGAIRAIRKAMDAEHYAQGDWRSQTIKIADLIHNTGSIKKHAPGFWKIYRVEKQNILEMLTDADSRLVAKAHKAIQETDNG